MDHNRLSVNASISSSSSYPFAQLNVLSLASCNLKSFPDLRNQSTLDFIDLSDNQIMGEIPNWIWEVGNGSIALLNLSHNLLQDLQKPYIIQSVVYLDIRNNQFRGDLPILPSSARYIDFSSNNFTHYIPADISKSVSEALFFSLSNNSLMGDIPESICNSNYLRILDLSNNFLSGTIPKCLLSSQTLGVLNLGRNNLSGTIPDAFSRRCDLRTLDLSRNSLTGKIPGSLSHCKLLEVLNVGNNKVEGIFPCMLKNSSSLRVLVLRSNRFHGELQCPGTNNSWPNLQIIDIAFNNFRGYLSPRFFLGWRGMMLDNDGLLTDNLLTLEFMDGVDVFYQATVTVTIKGLELKLVKILTAFTSIDLSSNNFRGEIPDTVGDLSSLYALNLSHNALIGQIPKSMGKLAQLESLDLSKNQLNGEIPKELTSLTFLSLLNLSYNKLVGSIPPGRQFQTYSSASFEGNTGLCGFPLNISCGEVSPPSSEDKQPYNSKTNKINWDYVCAAMGYSLGFVLTVWLVWLVL
ncbi:receptor 12 [Olea europaea subsp. europaea]|uniref:Receptor 12 n=1 Tax=Olea europaea subsp. europaea TaxID=158383 RepID=A0A8S0QGM0_OLEEU|nr:receptor 12 [Olea europaea subsp. europaea]